MLAKTGGRLLGRSAVETLNLVYSHLVSELDWKQRLKLDGALLGKLGPNGGWIIDDPDLPAELQGKEAPDWWDPFEAYRVGERGVAPSLNPDAV